MRKELLLSESNETSWVDSSGEPDYLTVDSSWGQTQLAAAFVTDFQHFTTHNRHAIVMQPQLEKKKKLTQGWKLCKKKKERKKAKLEVGVRTAVRQRWHTGEMLTASGVCITAISLGSGAARPWNNHQHRYQGISGNKAICTLLWNRNSSTLAHTHTHTHESPSVPAPKHVFSCDVWPNVLTHTRAHTPHRSRALIWKS